MTTRPAIHAVDIHRSFGVTRAVAGASIEVAEGELVALLGPSGSGKTTLLRIIAGFEVPDAGTVALGERTVVGPGTWVEPEHRHLGMVFQDGALFPHLTVAANVGFGEPREGRVEECLDLVGLSDRAKAYPHELSGGERQRVALARALANEPGVVLLDEPFAALDAGLRQSLREEVAAILRTAGVSAVLVTHDQQEALSLADQVVVMREGRVEQAGPPDEIYAHPASRWVAEFLGAAEVLPATLEGTTARCELGVFPFDGERTGDVEVVVRPEYLVLGPAEGDDGEDAIEARVVGHAFYGHDQVVRLELASGRRVHSRVAGNQAWAADSRVRVWVAGPVTVLSGSSSA